MKKLWLLLISVLMLTACSEDKISGDGVDLTNEFEITDDSNDPVQHERYQIFKEYNVPVLFNDTIAKRQIGTDLYGKPIMQYETVDLNWDFDSYSNSVQYVYDYLKTDESKMDALRFVRKFLEMCSKRMRPFSIMVANNLTSKPESSSLAEKQYVSGFRTLVFYNVSTLSDDDIKTTARGVIYDMVAQKVKANKDLCTMFEAVSSKYYYRTWEELGGCPTCLEWSKKSTYISTNNLYYGLPYNAVEGSTAAYKFDFVDLVTSRKMVADKEEAEEVLSTIVQEIGNYGFIRGNKNTGSYSPADAEEDRNYFVQAILTVGDEVFNERYGRCALVMEKYELLKDFMVNELGLEL